MPRDGRSFTDEELTAYLDAEADDALMQEINGALDHDRVLGERLAALRIPLDTVREALAPQRLGAPDAPDLPWVRSRSYGRVSFGGVRMAGVVAASVIAGVILGATMFRGLPPSDTPAWAAAAAAYQELYVAETLLNSEQSPEVTGNVLAGFGAAHGLSLSGLTGLEGVAFKRAQILGYEGQPLLQLAYLAGTDTPVSVCLFPVDGSDHAPQTTVLKGLSATGWVSRGVGFLVIGGRDDALTRRVADQVIAAL